LVPVQERPVSARGLRTRVFEAGPAAGREAVVLLHGAPGSAEDWQALLPQLGALGRTVAFDLPGFGEADKPSEWGYSPAEFGSFVGAVLDELRVEQAHLVMVDVGVLRARPGPRVAPRSWPALS
jgi:pimeloyl-ACP methyl ester carboxylesterase